MSRRKKPPAMTPKLSIRVPAFVTDESLGLGDAVSRIARAASMSPCGGCDSRRNWLNRWIVFSPK